MRTEQNTRIFAFITNKCRNACRYCFVYDGTPIENDMTLEQFNELCKIGIGTYKYITFIGGEPLLHPNLYELMRVALSYGYKISISTSGIINYDENNERIFSLPLDDVTLSLDSATESVNDALRGDGAFQRVIKTANYLKQKNIPFRVTATLCELNKNGVFALSDFVRSLGAFQLDIHVMSQKGRAERRYDLSLSPVDWYNIRKQLDTTKYPYPFQVSYPLMWYRDSELDDFGSYCDASNGHRLSIMSNCECYYCTIAIGFDEYKIQLNKQAIDLGVNLYSKMENLCEVEKRIETQDEGFNYICRFVKRKTAFI